MVAAEPGAGPARWGGAAWEVREAVRRFHRVHDSEDVCVALSGGPDSLALTAAACAEYGRVTALIVDHGLQSGSADAAGQAADAARALGARARVLHVTVSRGGYGPEDAARRARYAALDDARDGRPVLLGHTLDDQAETVLLGLARGAGARSLRGMAAWSPPWGRPLLAVRAERTRQACALLGLKPWRDPHNDDPAFTRVRVRSEVLPLLEEVLGGSVATGLARSAELFRDDDAELERVAAQVPVGHGPLEVEAVRGLARPVRTRVLRRWLAANGVCAPGYGPTRAVDALVVDYRGQGPVAVGGDGDQRGAHTRLVVVRSHGKLVPTSHPTGERGRP